MRGQVKWRGTKRMSNVHVRRVALCTSVREDAFVAPARLSTGDYPEDNRNRLATAVQRARDAAGPWSQQQLADRAKVSKRSIIYLENAEPRVGRRVLEGVGRALPGWTEDTPRAILEGEDPPLTDQPDPPDPLDEPLAAGGTYRELVHELIALDWSDRDIADALRRLRARRGDTPTVEPRGGAGRSRNATSLDQEGEEGTA